MTAILDLLPQTRSAIKAGHLLAGLLLAAIEQKADELTHLHDTDGMIRVG
jgi:hypothetical protein